MPSVDRIIERLPSLYRPELDATDLFTVFIRAISGLLDGVSKVSSDVMQSHWFAYADGALFGEFVRRSRELPGEPPVQRTDAIVSTLPYLVDLPRLAGLIDRNAPPGLGTRPFTVEEYAPLRVRTLAAQARGQPVDMVGPLMRWAIDSGSQKPVLPTAFVRGVTPVPGLIDATRQPVLERVHLNDNTGTGLAYEGELAPAVALALWPVYRSWLATEAGVDLATSSGDAASIANPTAPGPWATVEGGPAGTVVAFFQSADRFFSAAANHAGEGSLWRTDGTTWQRVLDGLPEVRCLAGRGDDLLIGLAVGVTALALYTPDAAPTPDPAALTGPEVHALTPDASGRWWAATSTGAAQLGNDLSPAPIGPGARPETETPLYSVFVDIDDTVFFGGELGVFQFQAAQRRWYYYGGAAVDEASPDWLPFDPEADPLPGADTVFLPPVRCLRRALGAALWLGTDNGIARYLAREHRRTFTTLLEAFPAVTQSPVRAFVQDERDRLWFATDTGLIVFDGADWWQRQGADLVHLFTELTVRSPLERGVSELTFCRFVRAAHRWQSLTPNGNATFVAVNPAPAAGA